MNGPTWRIDDEDGSPELTGVPAPLLVTGRALMAAIVRTWRIWIGAAIIGATLGLVGFFAMPHPASASTTLFMVHPQPGESAMTTDLTMLQTRTVAARVVAELGLEESPEALLSGLTVTPVNDQILLLEMSGPDEASAVERATSLVHNFLEFRAKEYRSVSDGLVKGYEKRIADLKAQTDALSRQYARLSAKASTDDVQATDILTARATLGNQITVMQANSEDASLTTDAAITATHVIDAPKAHPFGSLKQLVLFTASGAIVGAAAAVGVVLFRSLTSDRVRSRRGVAAALGVPVRVGVGPVPSQGLLGRAESAVTSRICRLLRGHPVRWTERRRRRTVEALVQGLESALPASLTTGAPRRGGQDGQRAVNRRAGGTTLGLVAIDRAGTAAVVLRAMADRLAEREVRVLLVDLSVSGALSPAPGFTALAEEGPPGAPRVYRPDGDPILARGPRRSPRRPAPSAEVIGELGAAWREADVVLVLVEVDPGIDLDLVHTWVTRLVPLVSAGRAGPELLATVASLVRENGLEMPFALLEGADRSDESLGRLAPMAEDRDTVEAVQLR